MLRRITLVVAMALLLFAPRVARAQEEQFTYEGPADPFYLDDDIGPTRPALRKARMLLEEFETTTVDMAGFCGLDPQQRSGRRHGATGGWSPDWDESDDDVRCNRILFMIVEIAALRGGNVYADAAVAWCIAAEITEEILPWIREQIRLQWEAVHSERLPTGEYLRNKAAWHAMSYADRFAFVFIEQVALELLGTIVVEPPE